MTANETNAPVEVSAGIVRRADGRVLVCRRGPGRRNAHLWEFPGGKREPGEDAAACLRRELLEELRLPVREVRAVHTAAEGGIRFTFLTAETDAEPVLTEHEAAAFLPPEELLRLPFCPADRPVAHALCERARPLRAFFWDYDGTLLDTYPVLTRAFTGICAELGAAVDEAEALTLMKDSLLTAVETVSRRSGLDAAELMRRIVAFPVPEEALRPVAGIPEALRRLSEHGGRHFLVTHNDRQALRVLDRLGLLPCFSGWVTREDGSPRKPAPDSLLHLLRKHQVNPAEAVMIGDRLLDIGAGEAAGMRTCLLDEENRFPDARCDYRVSGAAGLPEELGCFPFTAE